MSAIYMVKRDIHFYQSQVSKKVLNKLIQQDYFIFPSNVIGCSLTIANLDSLRTQPENDEYMGNWNCFGAGIDDVSYVGTQVYFTAWMQLLGFNVVATPPGVGDDVGSLSPQTSYLTIQAIAECE